MSLERTNDGTRRRRMASAAFGAALLYAAAAAVSRAVDEPGERDLARVRVTTNAREVAPCRVVAEIRRRTDRSLDALRREAAGAGADVLLLRELSATGISGGFYQCGTRAPAAPTPAPAAAPLPASGAPRGGGGPGEIVAIPSPLPAGERAAEGANRPASAETERQRRARAEFDALKAAVRVVNDPAEVASCEKRGEGRRDRSADAEEAFRGEAVTASANVALIRPAAGASLAAEYFRCGFPERPARKR